MMAKSEKMQYRAFLSYSHRDTAVARRLHKTLETFRIDKDLAGRETPVGPVPETLRPIFRDREDFSAGHSLSEQSRIALEASSFLIVLCSPNAAKSHYVNEEIRRFKALGRGDRVIPVIAEGTPDGEDECFPPALKFKVSKKGTITKRVEELLAADIREEGDGWSLAISKVAARLMGLGTDEVYRRAERERRRQGRIRTIAASVFAVLLIGGSFFANLSYQQQQTLGEIETLVARYSFVGSAEAAAPGAKEALTDAITAIAQGAAKDPRYAEALQFLKDGKTDEAEVLLRRVAEETAAREESRGKQAATAYRRLGAIAGIGDPKRAREAYAQAARLDPDHIEGMFQHGWFQKQAGALGEAERVFRRVAGTTQKQPEQWITYWARVGLGDIYTARGDLDAAAAEYRAVRKSLDGLAGSDPANARWQRDLSVSHNKIGDVLKAQGKLKKSLTHYRSSLAIRERLASSGPDNAGRQRDLSLSHNRIGTVLKAQGNLTGAQSAYAAALAIRKRLAASDPANAGWQRNLSISHERIGTVLKAQGDLTGAETAFRASHAIAERLAASDPANAGWQRDLSVSHEKIGTVLKAQGDLTGAERAHRASLGIAKRLAASDPTNTQWQRDLSFSHNKIGDVLVARGDLAGAQKTYRAYLAISERLAASDPANTGWQRDLSISHDKIGDILVAQGDLTGAEKAYRASLAIRKRLAASDPANAGWQYDLGIINERIGIVMKAQGNLNGALTHYRARQDIIEHLAASDPANAGWQRDLSVSYEKIGDVLVTQDDLINAGTAYRASLAILELLAAFDPANAGWQRDLAWSHWRFAEYANKPRDHWQTVVDILKKLDEEGRLPPADRKWLPVAEENLAKAE